MRTDKRTDRRTDMTKLTGAFRDYANAPEMGMVLIKYIPFVTLLRAENLKNLFNCQKHDRQHTR
jgi:hypothetical protein